MNEQEKALQGMIEFCQWLIPNAKQLGLEQSRSVSAISQAKTPQDLMNGVNSLYKELGEEQFTALTQAFQQSKQQAVKMAKNGSKIDYLVDKLEDGKRIPTHTKWRWTPWEMSFIAADAIDLPKRWYNHDDREYKRVISPTGEIRDRVIKKNGYGQTERRISPSRDTVYIYNGTKYYPWDDMYKRYENAWREYGVYENGGKINLDLFKNRK